MNEIEKAVSDFLAQEKIQFYTTHCGFKFRDKWPCDEWQIIFESEKGAFETEFFQGVGHRKLKKWHEKEKRDFIAVKNYLNPSTKNNIRILLEISEPCKPTQASVLYSLILDSGAIDTSFEYWCADYGYDTDSINAFETYRACCEIAKKLKKVFTQEQINKLQEMLQEY